MSAALQAIKENPQLGHQSPQRSQLAGWGPGPLQPMASTQHRPMHVRPALCHRMHALHLHPGQSHALSVGFHSPERLHASTTSCMYGLLSAP